MRIEIRTRQRCEFVDVTAQVADVVRRSGIVEGLAVVHCPHTTAGVTVNEHADSDVAADILAWLERAVPHRGDWRHSEGNSDAHVKATLVGSSATMPVIAGRLALGTWQGVFLCEFDGPRQRHLQIAVVGA